MKQLTVLKLIWELFKTLIKHGNEDVYYHTIYPSSFSSPMEVEEIQIRITDWGEKKIVIY